EQALARAGAERADGVHSLAERREAHGDRPPAAERRPAWPLLAAAAAVVVIATTVGVGVLLEDYGGSSDSSAGAGRAADEQGTSGEDAGEAAPSPGSTSEKTPGALADPPSVDTVEPGELAELARELESGTQQPVRPQRSCAKPTQRYGDGPVSLIVFDGDPAVAVLDTKTRTVTILDCATARAKLLATGY
ncbi:MAG: hypothetical protein M3445_01195, partial [Actinomycetota bacterium]|nr:hypothetical protein [Actinomycetota bacterium]